ncbi:hypothetical protein V1277_002326 [Bradyrhizobium sp. AZCC 1588]|uniref:hypothetical protein n=1 Tax=unclassified Bradyrhizobium TaxID=2631580 RepID=UPI002FEFA608
MTARNCCAATAGSNLLSLPDLPCLTANGALQPACQLAFVRRKRSRKICETNFLFFVSRIALIDAILLTGIAFHQIR